MREKLRMQSRIAERVAMSPHIRVSILYFERIASAHPTIGICTHYFTICSRREARGTPPSNT